jgi:TolB-like protein
LLIIAAVLFGLDVRGVRSRVTGAAGATARVVRLAVLPFANVSGDAAQEYLSDGLTQEMIAQLGRLHPGTLSVIARTSVMQYKKTNAPINQIGRELGVDYVLEGSAQRETGQVRITAALIKVADQTQLWAESYEREISGILALQSEVAQKVASALALKLLPAERARLANVRTINPDAYEAYLKGLQRMYRLTPDDLTAALKYFEVALAKEPDYALAYAGISLTWSCRNQMYVSPPSEAVPKAKAAALKAIELDDSLAEAHLALAGLWSWADWNLPAADAEWRRAIQLNPSYPDAHAFYSHYLMHMGRPTEAMAEIDRGLALDPFNPIFQSFYAIDLVYARRYDDALGVARKAPGNPVAVTAVWWAYSLKKMPKEAYAAVKAYLQMAYGDKGVEDALDQGYAHGGYPEAAKRAAAALIARGRTSFVGPIDVANLYVDAGEKKLALDWLEKSFEARDPNVPYIGIPFYHSLRQEPRYQALLRRIGLPQ